MGEKTSAGLGSCVYGLPGRIQNGTIGSSQSHHSLRLGLEDDGPGQQLGLLRSSSLFLSLPVKTFAALLFPCFSILGFAKIYTKLLRSLFKRQLGIIG